jgi:hypothetical protein
MTIRTSSTGLFSFFLALFAILHCDTITSQARPYASSLTNNAGTISFRLNESADNVKVVSGGVTNDLGALPAGLHSFGPGVSDPYQVEVFKASPAGFATAIAPNRGAVLQISTDSNPLRFLQPRGLAVNTDPTSPYFGRVYVANAAAGTTSPGARSVGDGIYIFNADLSDAVGQGDTPRTGGLDFVTGGAVTPYRLSLGQDGKLYIADWSDSTGTLYVTDPDVSPGSSTNVLGGPTGSAVPVGNTRVHGSIAAAVVTGTVGTGDLTAYVIDEDLQNDRTATALTMINSLWRHDIGASLPGPTVMPTLLRQGGSDWIAFASQTMDLGRGPNGYFYVNDYRSVGSDRSGLTVLDTNGTSVLWSSLPATRAFTGNSTENDLLRATGGGGVSPRGDYFAVINIETNGITVVPLIEGIPDLTNRLVFHGMGTTNQGREVAFDIAGNLYAISQGSQILRTFSPGGAATTITTSDGTFSMSSPPVVLRVTATDDQGSEEGSDTITFSIWREAPGDTALAVNYTLIGSASNGIDYVTNVLSATIPAGETNVLVVITPIDDGIAEPSETVTLSLLSSADYNIVSPAAATAFISDNEPIVSLSVPDEFGSEEGPDTITFNIIRTGNTAQPLTVNYQLTGTATNGLDYVTNTLSATIPAGETNALVVITPIDDSQAEFTETVILTLLGGIDYTVGSPSTGTAYISDNEFPELRITATDSNAFERFPNDVIVFTITKLGNTNASQFVLMDFGGTALPDVDYVRPFTDPTMYFAEGMVTTNLVIRIIDDALFEGDETITVTLQPNDYTVGMPGSASARIQDDEYGPEDLLFADNFNSDTSADWILRFGANNNILDYTVDWPFDYATIGVPPAPGSLGADTMGVRISVNKTNSAAGGGAGLNLYPRDRNFSGDYALRFDLYLSYGTASTTEHALTGINHSGQVTNRISQSTTGIQRGTDGIWVAIESDGSANREWAMYTSTNAASAAFQITNRSAASLTNILTSPPYTVAGSVGNSSSSGTKTWADVELSQVGRLLTLKVNRNIIYRFTNTFGFSNGTIMIGHNDQFDSVGSLENFAIFDNVRVVRLGTRITSGGVSGNTVTLNFVSSDGGAPTDFHIDSTPTLSPPSWTEESSAITSTPGGYQATLSASGPMRFYRVRR